MTISSFMIYLFSLADSIIDCLAIIMFMCVILCIVFCVIFFCNYEDSCYHDKEDQIKKPNTSKKYIKSTIIIFIVALFICTIIPTTKTLIAMYTIPPIVNNKQVQQLPENLLKFANDYLTKEEKKHD